MLPRGSRVRRRTTRIEGFGGRSTMTRSSTRWSARSISPIRTSRNIEAEYRQAVALLKEAQVASCFRSSRITAAYSAAAAAAAPAARFERRGQRRGREHTHRIHPRTHPLLAARHLGHHPTAGRKPQGECAGERGGSGQCAIVGAGYSGGGLLRSARRRFAAHVLAQSVDLDRRALEITQNQLNSGTASNGDFAGGAGAAAGGAGSAGRRRSSSAEPTSMPSRY